MPKGTLYIVATPIGNLADITLRAIEILRGVALIACEDTRRTRPLLQGHGIKALLVSHHAFNENEAARGLVKRLLEGADIALVSDGGTPAISDPGYRLVAEALAEGITVTPIPGACAFVAAASASGLPTERITFRGFLPHRSAERRRAIEAFQGETATQVLYESPHRIAASLADLAAILGSRRAAVARELTKKFETWYRGTLPDLAAQIAAGPARGEYCVVIEAAPASGLTPRRAHSAPESQPENPLVGGPDAAGSDPDPEAALRVAYERALAGGADPREALRRAASECGVPRKRAYTLLRIRNR